MINWMKKVLATFGLTAILVMSLVLVSQAASISGQLTYTGTATGPVFVGAYTDPSMMGISVSSTTIPSGAFPVNYLLSNLTNGTYYVGAMIDKNSNNIWDSGEPWGQYGMPDPVTISGANIEKKDFPILDEVAGNNSISGTISYTGTKTGQLIIEVWNNSTFTGTPTKVLTNPGAYFPFPYYVANLSDGTYYIKAFLDSNYNNMSDFTSEACGKLGEPPEGVAVNGGQSVTSKNLTLNDPGEAPPSQPPAGSSAIILGADGFDFSASTTSAWSASADMRFTAAFGGSDIEVYNENIRDIGPVVSIDTVNNFEDIGTTDYITPIVGHGYTFKDRVNKPVIIKIENISSLPYPPFTPNAMLTFSYRYDYVIAQGPPFTIKLAVGTDITATTGAEVALYDSKGDWSKDNDVRISSSTTVGTYTTENSNKYNVVLNVPGIPTYQKTDGSPYNYVIYISMTGKRVEERMINFNANYPSTLYTSWIVGSSYITLRDASTVAITEFGIKVGDTTAATGTISPDNDGTADFCEIVFKYTVTGATDSWEKGAQARICIDTNGDGVFTAFDYSKFFWDENGGPYYDKADPANWTWDKFQAAKTAGTLSQYKLSQQEFDALRAGTDWSMDQWIDSWGLDVNNSTTKSIRWEGRDNSWNVVPANTVDYPAYKVQIQVDNPNWFEGDGISWQNYKTPTDNPLTVTVTGAGISGTVKDDQGTAVSGIRVNAGSPPPGGWGSSYTKADGTYKISGLPPGTYHVNTESGGSGYPNKDYPSEVPVTAGNITTGIDFTLERGGQITGKITIPAPGFKQYKNPWYQGNDPTDPGYYITNGWIEIQAWAPNSPEHGWTNVEVQDDGNDAIDQEINYTLNIAPGTYTVSSRMEGFASEAIKDITVTKGTPTTLNITLAKAGSIAGTVSLPAGVTASEFLFVDISAESTDGKYFSWGGTPISSGTALTTYEVKGLPNASYKVRFNIWGKYKPGEIGPFEITTANKNLTGKDYTFDLGAKVTGKLKINGDTSNYQEMGGGPSGGGGGGNDIYVWINCWSPESGYGTGTQVKATKQTANQSIDYEIGGLEPGKSYQVDCWLFGFEMAGWPLTVSIPAGATSVSQEINLNPYSGSIAGTVTGTGINYSRCRVTAREPWWGTQQAPKHSDVDSSGAFSITGLGTGEYIVTCNEYYVKPSTIVPLGVPTGKFGTVMERTPLANGENLTGVTLALSTGGKITGTVALTSNVYTINDLNQKIVSAVPMRMQWMGWAAPYIGIVSVNAGVATYSLDGLSDDVYIVTPPLYIEQKTSSWGMPEPDLAGEKQLVTVKSGETVTDINFALTDGYNISGTVQRPVSGDEEHFHLSLTLQKTTGGEEELSGANVDFANMGPDQQDLDKRSLSFTFKHVPPNNTGEKYIIKVFTQDYKITTKEVTLTNADVNVGTLTVSKGATIKGKLVDAETGQSLSGDNGLTVICEARPWVEGSYRSTSEWMGSGSSAWEEQSSIKTGVFRLKNLPAGTYLVRVTTQGEEKGTAKSSKTTKNYVSMYLAGVVVPDSTEEVDIGTIKLRGGLTISGTVTDKSGNVLPNIWMAARPSATRGEAVTCKATTDANGKYVISGIDPLIGYWGVTAAARPWWGEGIRVKYGDEKKANIVPGATGVNFELTTATGNLIGKVLKADANTPLAMPFPGENMPVAELLLQNNAKTYTQPMEGIEQGTWPDGSFTIQGLVPGTYTLAVYSKGAATAIIPNITIVAGDNTMADIQLVKGGTVTGTIKTTAGLNINTSMYELPLAMKADFTAMVFGTFNSNNITKEIESYSIEGLAAGVAYYVVLAASEGADIYVSTTTVTLASASEVKTHNIVYQSRPPEFLVSVYKDATGKFNISAWASKTLKEDNAADVLTLKNTTAGDGISEGTLGDLVMSPNRQQVTAVYTPVASDVQATITVTGHDVLGVAATPKDYTFGMGVDAYNLTIFNPLIGGTLDVGGGDSTDMKIPGGAIESTDNVDGSMSKVAEVGTTSYVTGAPLSLAAYPPKFVQAAKAPKPAKGDKVSPYYEVSIGASQIASGKTAKVTLQYTPGSVTDTSKIDIYSFDGTKWVIETDGREVDTVNHTVSANVSHTSLFAIYETQPDAPTRYTGDFKAYMYPSPFNPETQTATFRIKLQGATTETRNIKIQIYNIAGELVRELKADSQDTGVLNGATVTWDGKNDGGQTVASGVYIYRLSIDTTEKQIKKIAIIK